MSKIAVYTFAKGCSPRAFEGEPNVDYFAFTDSAAPAPWKTCAIEFNGSAYDVNKYYKWHPHLFFADYDYAIYADAVIAVNNVHKLIEAIGAGSASGINLAMHREHNTPAVELEKCIQCRKFDVAGRICATEYVRAHASEYPVPECTTIVYDLKKLSITALDEIWRQYCISAAHRDQLVVNYALAKAGFNPLRQQTLPGYIPMGKFTYGIPQINHHPINEAKKDNRKVALLPAVVMATPGNATEPPCNPEYLKLLPSPTVRLSGWKMRGYYRNEHHILPSQVQGWLPEIMKALGISYTEPKTITKKMKFGPHPDQIKVPAGGHYTLYLNGKHVREGGPEVLSKPLVPHDAYHDLWWAKWEPTMTVRDGDGPDILLIGNSMIIPLLPLLAAVCHRLVYIDNRGHRNLDWLRPEEYPHRAVLFDPACKGQEHTALEGICVLSMFDGITGSRSDLSLPIEKYAALHAGDVRNQFKRKMHYDLNLEHPKTFCEKMAWLKVYDSTPLKTRCADKIEVREYVKEKIGVDLSIPVLGVYDKFSGIPFERLPKNYVLKCNHGSGMNILVKGGALDKAAARKKIDEWMRTDYLHLLEYHYKPIPKKIFVEPYLENGTVGLIDYKFWCFNGQPKFYSINAGHGHGAINYYDLNGAPYPIERFDYPPDPAAKWRTPSELGRMIEYAKKLSADFKFVRVDFYEVNGRVYFGELTFIPGGGYIRFKGNTDATLGAMLDLQR